MAVKYILMVNMQGQTRVAKYANHSLTGEQVRPRACTKAFMARHVHGQLFLSPSCAGSDEGD